MKKKCILFFTASIDHIYHGYRWNRWSLETSCS